MHRGFAPVLILIVVAVVALGAVAYFQIKLRPQPQSQPTQVISSPISTPNDASREEPTGSAVSPAPNGVGDTANWKTYKNPKLKYEIKYPNNFRLIERDFGEGYVVAAITDMKLADGATYPSDDEILVPSEYTQEDGDPAIYKGFIFSIRPVFDVNQNFDIMTVTKKPPVRFNNANVYNSPVDIFKKNNFQGGSIFAVAVNDSYDYRYDLSAQFNADKQEYFSLLDQILSTFKFLD